MKILMTSASHLILYNVPHARQHQLVQYDVTYDPSWMLHDAANGPLEVKGWGADVQVNEVMVLLVALRG